jgi:hypothetical protein
VYETTAEPPRSFGGSHDSVILPPVLLAVKATCVRDWGADALVAAAAVATVTSATGPGPPRFTARTKKV